ncbi:MAG TPA: hypothetical protein VIF62_14580 [Labilithrix sp.]|jgi:hypothetical protein
MADEDASLAMKELREVFEDLDTLLKNPSLGGDLTSRGINVSLAIVAAEALLAYVEGDKARAAEDFSTVAEEIASRAAASAAGKDGVA